MMQTSIADRGHRTMSPARGRYLHEGGFFRPCSRCGRRTFWLCEDCGRPACPECATVERVRVGTSDRLHRMCRRCRLEYRSPDLLGTTEDVWTALCHRIEADALLHRRLSPPPPSPHIELGRLAASRPNVAG
jgi:hypothetical protein